VTAAIILLALAALLIVAEILVPSGGILSLLAGASVVASLVFAFRAGVGAAFLVSTALVIPAAIGFGMYIFPKTPLGRRMIAPGLSGESRAATDVRDLELVGQEGVVVSPLRPAGFARLNGRRVDVVSRGEVVETGVRVRVISVRGNRVVVAPIAQEDEAELGA